MKTIMVTGASGYLGHSIVNLLAQKKEVKTIAILGRPEDFAYSISQDSNVVFVPCSSVFQTVFGHIDTLIHTAFSRGEKLEGLASSIHFTERIIEMVNSSDIDSLINISSQGVYRSLKKGEMVKEDGVLEPNTSYGLAKIGVEKMISLGCKKSHTSIRMASLSRNAHFLDLFVDSIISGNKLTITTPNRYASIMDITDAVNGIITISEISELQRESVYNLGPECQFSILDYAVLANAVGQEFGFKPTTIEILDNGINSAICMDCSRLRKQTGWECHVSNKMMIRQLFMDKLHG